MTIGLVGKGFIGEAFYEYMKQQTTVMVYDTDSSRRTVDTMKELVDHCGVIFVSVPTPMTSTGACDTSIVQSVVDQINKLAVTQKIVVIRSTVPPGTCEKLNKGPYGLSVVFNPEFLTEANHIEDFKNQDRIVLGGLKEATSVVADIYKNAWFQCPIVETDWRTAEMVKYFNNTFLATKVTFANEMKQICDAAGIDYDKVVNIATLDKRIGKSHLKVPGPDGHFGFGGTCFPKDINALIAHAKKLKVDVPVLKAIWKKNLQLRPERDWEQLKGRAVT